jgi:hypothetical protein
VIAEIFGTQRAIAAIDQKSLVELARRLDALIELDCAVGDTIVYDIKLLQVRGASLQLPETELLRARIPQNDIFKTNQNFAERGHDLESQNHSANWIKRAPGADSQRQIRSGPHCSCTLDAKCRMVRFSPPADDMAF